jgi:hypothetical protein
VDAAVASLTPSQSNITEPYLLYGFLLPSAILGEEIASHTV